MNKLLGWKWLSVQSCVGSECYTILFNYRPDKSAKRNLMYARRTSWSMVIQMQQFHKSISYF